MKLRNMILLTTVFILGLGLYVHSRYVMEKKEIFKSAILMGQVNEKEDLRVLPIEERISKIDTALDKALFDIILEVLYMASLFILISIPYLVRVKKHEEACEQERRIQEIEISQLQQMCNGMSRKRLKG